jgi:hypothetical protein
MVCSVIARMRLGMSYIFQQVWRLIFMSKERELLERWVLQNNFAEYYALREETVTFLAQPEQKPVAWMQDDIELYVLEEKNILRGYVIPLYTAPPKREPLSDETIAKLWGGIIFRNNADGS